MKNLMITSTLITLAFLSCNKQNEQGCAVIKEKYVHEYGLEIDKNEWKDHGKNGEVISTLDNGVTVRKHYLDGIIDGEVSYSFPHSEKIERLETYSDGNLVKIVIHDEMGNPSHETLFSNDYETVTTWYETGNPKSKEIYHNGHLLEGEYYNFENEIESKIVNGKGQRPKRNAIGELIATDIIENGHTLSSSEYFLDGSVKSITPFVNNQIHGQKKYFKVGGEPDFIENWKNNVQEGISISYKNGEKHAEIPYIKGKKDGVEKRFKNGNIVVEEISWKNGKLHGPSITYVDGIISKTVWYYQNKLVPKATYDIKTRHKVDGL